MAPGTRRPPPDRSSILSSIGLPPRDDIPTPASPSYDPGRPQGTRRSRTGSTARRSERSFRDSAPPNGARYHSNTDPLRQGSRPSMDYDGGYGRPRARHESISSRPGDHATAPRARTNSTRRPAIPSTYMRDDDYDRERERERDRPARDERGYRDYRDELSGSRRERPRAPASVRGDRTRDRERNGDADGDRSKRRSMRAPDYDDRENDDFDDFDNRGGRREFSKVSGSRTSRPMRELEPYEDAQEPVTPDRRRRSMSAPYERPRGPSTYGKDARADDLMDHEHRASSKKKGMLSRVLSTSSRPAKGPPPSNRLTRYNTMRKAEPADPRDDNTYDEREEERLAKERLGALGWQRRSQAFDESHPLWLKGGVPGVSERESLKRRPSESQPARARERQRTLDSLERPSGRGNGVARSHSKGRPAPVAAAAAAATGGAVGGGLAAKAAARDDEINFDDDESDASVSSVDRDLLQDAPEAPDVHDEDALSSIVLGKAPPAGTAPVTSAGFPAAILEEDSSAQDSSEESSTEETSSEEDDEAEDETQRVSAAKTVVASPNNKTNGAAPAIAGALATPVGGKTNGKAPVVAPVAPAEDDDDSEEEEESSGSGEESSSEEDEPSVTVAPAVAPASQSKARRAPAAVAGAGAAGIAGIVAAGAIKSRKSQELADKAAQRERAAEIEKQRLLKEKADLEHQAEAERLRAEKASRKEEKRKAKEAAEIAAAAAAVKEKEARRAEKEKARQAKEQERLKAKESKRAAVDRKQQEKSAARDRAIREREDAEEKRLMAIREEERAREEKLEARRQSRRKPHGARGPAMRDESVRALTPQQRHYLLKALIMMQMQSEWSELEKLGALTEYGYPFSSTRSKLTRIKTFDKSEEGEFAKSARDPYANDDKMRETENLQEPLILRHLFHVHLHSFPGLDTAPEKYWQKRIQPFFDEMAARNFSTSIERGEISKRRLYSYAATRYLGSFFARGFGVRGEGELRGPGVGEPGSERWGVGKQWGKGTVKRGLDKPIRIEPELMDRIDNLFEGEGGRIWREAGKDWRKIRRDWCGFKESIIESETGLEEVISYLDISNVKNLPPHYKNSVEFARIHAAYIFHALFVTAPNADELYKVVKGIHALAPYWGAKQLLKYANAETMISGILSLLLARPGGAKSLIQRIFSYVIGKDASYIQKEFVTPIRKEIDDAELTRKIEEYVKRGDRVEAMKLRELANKRGEDIVTTILLSPSEPRLGEQARDHVLELQRCFALSPYRGDLSYAYPETTPLGADKPPMPSWGAQSAEHVRARKFALLKLLLRESLKRRDREQAVEFASGSLIPAIIKDSLQTVFYPIIREIAATANLSERLGDLQKFLDDLLDVKKRGDDGIEAWIALAARHEQSLYFLFHECSSIAKPLWDWCQLGLDYMALSTSDPAHPADRSANDIEVNFEELLQDARLSDGDVKKILAEMDRLAAYTKWSKVRYELEARKNYLLARPEAASPSGLCEAELPDTALKEDLQDIDGMMRDLLEEEGLKLDEGVCDDGVRGTEKYDFPWAFFAEVDPLNQHLPGEPEAGVLRVPKVPVNVAPPTLKHTRKVLPLFCEVLASKLPEWQSEDVLGNLGGPDVFQKGGPSKSGGARMPSFKKKFSTTSFDKSTSFDSRPTSGRVNDTKSLMSTTSSRFKLPSLFARK